MRDPAPSLASTIRESGRAVVQSSITRTIGSNAFGVEELRGVRKHAFEHYFDLVGEGLDLTPLITHRFPLSAWDDAIVTIAGVKRTGAVKVLLSPDR